MNIADLSEDSNTSDEDYAPGGKPEEVLSEVDSEGDPEDALSESEETARKGRKRRKQATKSRKKQKNKANPSIENEKEEAEATNLTEEEQKKQDDDLWADFMKDTGFKPKSSKNDSNNASDINKSKSTETKKNSEKVKITEIFEFAGEEVKVEKEVPADSATARLLNQSNSSISKRGQSLKGIGSILSQLGKKQKISTLEKSKLDWDRFKKEENIEEELQTHNKGKDGYLERQDFLQRADLRRFEIEKEVRSIERSKRLNNFN